MSIRTTSDLQPVTLVGLTNNNATVIGTGQEQQRLALTGNTATQVFAAVPGVRHAVSHIHVSNSSNTSVLVQVLDGSTPIWDTFAAASGGGAAEEFVLIPLVGSVNTALQVQLGASVSTVYVTIVGYQTL